MEFLFDFQDIKNFEKIKVSPDKSPNVDHQPVSGDWDFPQ